jgi:hypothetical protein
MTFLSPFGVSPDVPASGDPDSVLLDAALDQIYLLPISTPVVLWIARSAHLTVGRLIPLQVTLSFAPGAVLRLDSDVTLDIGGRLDAGMEERFLLGEGAKVRLRGPLDEIHAAWWAAEPFSAKPVIRALEALWDRYANNLDPAPIILVGPYSVKETIPIVPPSSVALEMVVPFFEVVLRGRHHTADDPMTFQVVRGRRFDAILALGGAVTSALILTLEHVGFDLTSATVGSSVPNALILAGDHDRTFLDSCYFRFAGATGVRLTARWQEGQGAIGGGLVDETILKRITGRSSRVDVSRCVFEGRGDGGVAIKVDVSAPTFLWVTDSMFCGSYHRAIAFVGSELMVTACTFDNTVEPTKSDPLQGVDIHLGALEGEVPKEAVMLPGANAHLTVNHSHSTSPTFLAGRRVFVLGDSGGAVLTNVIHQPAATSQQMDPSSVRWGLGYEVRSLTLNGCALGTPVRLADNAPAGTVVDLGTSVVQLGGSADSVVTLSTSRT